VDIREVIFLLLLMVLVWNVPQAEVKPRWPLFHQGINLLAWAALIMLACNRWQAEIVVIALGNIATVTMDMAFPLKYSAIDSLHYRERCLFFYHWSLLSAGLVLFNWFCLRRLSREWSAGTVRRWIWAGLLTGGILAVSSYVVWIWVRGLREISPYLAEVGVIQPFHGWIAIAAIYLVLITTIAYGMSADTMPAIRSSSAVWRRNSDKYYHEWRSVLLGLAIAIIVFRYYSSYQLISIYHGLLSFDMISVNIGSYHPYTPPVYSFYFFAYTFFSRPWDLLWTGLLILCIVRGFRPRSNMNGLQVEVPRIRWAKFITIWLATAAFVVSGTLALVWMLFSLWLKCY
jgi:hypothetical protein